MSHLRIAGKLMLVVVLLLAGTVAHSQGRHARFMQVTSIGKFKPGFYTLLDGSRHGGKLRVWQDLERNVVQVEQGKADPINLQTADLQGFTIGTDSFAVVRQVAMVGAPTEKPFGEAEFFRVMLTGRIQVLQHDQLMRSHNTVGHLNIWLLRMSPESAIVGLPYEQSAFAQHASTLFVDNPLLCQRIRAGLVGPDDFKRIIYAYLFKREIEQVSYEEAANIFRQ
ncbi:hypothetical protein H8B13_09380 [Hymenobacter sp. BT188]|uniref:hypothetical protein n=1 Tax=Hymenobacter sp. BT188 TaxID=2763504 RepID=UPI001650F4B4|nr:hypothetical protein [Hymenobacter sp. BT188]MBC6607029.1 hypothetical protein [Hymenobacter sp. BT188]